MTVTDEYLKNNEEYAKNFSGPRGFQCGEQMLQVFETGDPLKPLTAE